ncbi:Lengsin [Holothuria leucospilota]|uniref:Lengsin n=1 Tax=Holothuria leucospilota TaxID=206669 RepID=A0A9Q1BMF1_HOLLE|nr:Lengsin [Holothuria leucospilota]
MAMKIQQSTTETEKCIDLINDLGIEFVRYELYDMNSVARSKTYPARHFQSCVKSGISFPHDFLVFDTQGNNPETHLSKKYLFSDMLFYPDLSTVTVLPWVEDTARVFLSVSLVGEGDKVTIDPRNIAQAQLTALEERKISLLSSFEYEFWVVEGKSRKTITEGLNICSTLRLAEYQKLFNSIAKNLYKAGVDIERLETEYAPGQFEMPIKPSFGIRAADNAATFRTGVKEMAKQQGFSASFMTKLFKDQEGSSGHLNHSLWSLDRQTPLHSDKSRPNGLSKMGEHWIAGLLAHAPALSLLQSPSLNCRDTFRLDTFAPSNATWGVDNRTCAVRLKRTGVHGSYIENRLGSSAGNPYISLAAMIAAGIDGIDRKLPLPEAVPFNKPSSDEASIPPGTVPLPNDIDGALKSLTEDTVLCKAFGFDFIQAFRTVKMHEKKLLSSYCGDKNEDAYKWFKEFYFDYI